MKLSGDPETLQRFVKHVPLSLGLVAQTHNKYGVPCTQFLPHTAQSLLALHALQCYLGTEDTV